MLQRGSDAIWMPTELGGRFLNDLQAEFIVDRDAARAFL